MRQRAHHAVIILALLAACTAETRAGEVWEDPWIEVRSPNFVVASALGQSDTMQLVRELEDFRTLVSAVTNAGVLEERIPTRVYVFKDAVADLGLDDMVVGRFIAGMRANYAMVRRNISTSNRALQGLGYALQFEYTAFLMRNQNVQGYPPWYGLGLASLLGTSELRGDRFIVGTAPPGSLYVLSLPGRWLPYAQVVDESRLSRTSGHDVDLYRAQSWLLVHYLSFGKPGLDFPAALKEYLADRGQGMAPVAAFEKAFHEDVGKLGNAMRRYLKQAKATSGTLKHGFEPGKLAARDLPTDEVAADLAGLALEIRQYKAAGKYSDAALIANPDNAAAIVARADLFKVAGRYAEAEALYSKAIALEPDNDLHHLDFGEYWLDRTATAADESTRHDFFNKARLEFYQADKLNDHNPETLAYYGWSYLVEKTNPAKGIPTLEYANQLLPSKVDIGLMLAQLYLATDQPAKAHPLLQTVVTWGNKRQVEFAGKLLADMGKASGSPRTPTAPASQP